MPTTPVTFDIQSFGRLRINVRSLSGALPISDATIRIQYESGTTLEELQTDSVGQTSTIELPAPPLAYSQEPSALQPYSNYTLLVEADGYESVVIDGAEILPTVTALQEVNLLPRTSEPDTGEAFVIPPHTLYGEYPPKIAEDEVKQLSTSGEIVLSEVVIPEYIVVHDGPPTDSSAQNYYVRYKDYIKNVASSEIYATWPEATIVANILAIQSFTLNRVFTEWYRNRGYNFTITSSTAFDHKWIPERNIFDNISQTVDAIFTQYLGRPAIQQPILTQYCDGRRVTCPGWMSQWGSKYLGDEGYSASEIIRNYYGNTMEERTATEVSGIPSSYPGVDLQVGSRGTSVTQIQRQLNRISDNYPLIPKIVEDGIYGERTAEAVRIFQSIFGLPQSGVVDYRTWYKISEIYVAVSRIAELV